MWATGDEVKLGEPGCRESYYADGFKDEADSKAIDRVQAYVVLATLLE